MKPSYLLTAWLVLVHVLAVLFVLRKPADPVIVSRVTTDTVEVRDTVWMPGKVIQVPVPVPPADTLGGLLRYRFQISDSLIDGQFTAWTRGQVEQADFEYTPKFPKYIETVRTVTNTTTHQVDRPVPVSFWFAGMDAGLGPDRSFVSVSAGRVLAGKRLVYYRFDPLNGSHHLGVSVLAW